jgi:hypothetical protein
LIENIERCCERLRGQAEKYDWILKISDFDYTDNFIELHCQAMSTAKFQYDNCLRDKPLDSRLIDNIRRNVARRISKAFVLRSVLNTAGNRAMADLEPSLGLACRYEGWSSKREILDTAYAQEIGTDISIAEGMAYSEDSEILSVLSSQAATRMEGSFAELDIRIAEAVKILQAQGYDQIIILATETVAAVQRWEAFHHDRSPGYRGSFDGLPIFAANILDKSFVIVASVSSFIGWNRPPSETGDFDIDFQTINREEAAIWLKDHPEDLKSLGAETLEEGIEKLQLRVRVTADWTVPLAIRDPEAAIVIHISSDA